ncbi:MAG TPA: MarR family winged helix-turn-helix transcriptional regulator [Candidatus Acidoferrum sp.]
MLANLDLTGTGYCASLNFRRTARAITRMYDAAMQASGVRSTQFAILIGIAKTQPVSMSVLAKVLVIDRTTLTRSLRLLQKEKLVTISARSTMRQKFLELTPAGERALERSLPLWRAVHAQFVSTVGSDYWLKLRSELEGLAKTTMALGPPFHDTPVAKKSKQNKPSRHSNPAEN